MAQRILPRAPSERAHPHVPVIEHRDGGASGVARHRVLAASVTDTAWVGPLAGARGEVIVGPQDSPRRELFTSLRDPFGNVVVTDYLDSAASRRRSLPAMSPSRSPSFAFLDTHDSRLVILGTRAERLFSEDPNAALTKRRLYAELLAQRLNKQFDGKLDEIVGELRGEIWERAS